MPGKRSWEGVKLGLLAAVLLVAGFVIAYRFASPAPPSSIRLGAGEPGGAYALFAEQYRRELARNGIDVEVVNATGSVENLARLARGELDVALVQAGVAPPEGVADPESLGSLFHEPLWVFLRHGIAVDVLTDLRGRAVEIGPLGSGTRALALRLLARNGLGAGDARWLGDSSAEAVDALLAGRADALFLVASVDSPLVRTLFETPGIEPLDMQRAEAYTRLDRALSRVSLPRGVIDLQTDLPPHDVDLVATSAEFAISPDFHPALVDLLLQAAQAVHGRGDVIAPIGRFPSARFIERRLSPEAARYYKYGPPFLQRYLPFWAATQIDRLKVMLIPLIALLLPLVRIFPPTYRWRVRSRIYRWYRELRLADPVEIDALDDDELEARLADVRRIEREVVQVPTPTSYGEELYSLRLHVDFVARRLVAASAARQARADRRDET